MRYSEDQLVRVDDVVVRRATDKAIGFVPPDSDDDELVWVPKSQLVDGENEVWEQGDEGTLVIPRWLATEKGLG